ncbi:hypothetical protein CHU92_14645 [Flavobacterium cyanobacteriorum]|uniref:Polysaccharide (De)acetylase n=1 Tax=Flavobacterium cyanobacteriorum TaxID=2022802 RepID=A0A255YSF7_9FLAO|nr:hypothetical protein CHU92_14645 [Flavobacterium cyanobacteriorum]
MAGWKTKRQLVIFTSDDWGSVRVPSAEARENLSKNGISMDSNRFNRFDTLESNKDMECLFEILTKHKDRKGCHPVFTALTNVANPDFETIEKSAFTEYAYEPFTTTLSKYEGRDKVYEMYKQGIAQHIFVPEFHGREHVNINRWMKALHAGHEVSIKAFREHFYFIDDADLLPEIKKGFDCAFDIDSPTEVQGHKAIIKDGLDLFENLFNYRASFFTAPSMIFSPAIEIELKDSGIEVIDVPRLQKIPLGNNRYKKKLNFMGSKNTHKQFYVTRNAVFEPNIQDDSDSIGSCLKNIAEAFKNNSPAIISNHRAAFTGGLNPENREKGIKALDCLLGKIVDTWPNVEFITMKQLHYIMNNSD